MFLFEECQARTRRVAVTRGFLIIEDSQRAADVTARVYARDLRPHGRGVLNLLTATAGTIEILVNDRPALSTLAVRLAEGEWSNTAPFDDVPWQVHAVENVNAREAAYVSAVLSIYENFAVYRHLVCDRVRTYVGECSLLSDPLDRNPGYYYTKS